MRILHTPGSIAPPFSRYSHGVEAKDVSRWLLVSGQVGVDSGGRLAETAAGQMHQTWQNVFAVLASADMTPGDLVKITAFITRRDDLATFREVRDGLLGSAQPASSLVIVAGLADPDWLVEIEAVAAA